MILGDKYDGKIVKTLEGMEWGGRFDQNPLYIYKIFEQWKKSVWLYKAQNKFILKQFFVCYILIQSIEGYI